MPRPATVRPLFAEVTGTFKVPVTCSSQPLSGDEAIAKSQSKSGVCMTRPSPSGTMRLRALDKNRFASDAEDLGKWLESNFDIRKPLPTGLIVAPMLAAVLCRSWQSGSSAPLHIGPVVVYANPNDFRSRKSIAAPIAHTP
ncbi:MAG: hypothetical protein GXP40_04690 [Chloroflexi bacterium]|nr:hypothetical protein [Chloroflexota bacterium]